MNSKTLRRGLSWAAFAIACAASAAQAAPKPMSAPVSAARASSLETDIKALVAPIGGVVGVAAWRLDGTGPKVLVNADDAFPMASTFKVAVTGAILEKVEKGTLKLEDMIPVTMDDMVPSEVIADRFIHPGLSMSIYNLLELMLTQSDNTATDVLTRIAGGPAAVTDWAHRNGAQNLRVDGATDGILRRYYGMAPEGSFTAATEAMMKANPNFNPDSDAPNNAFDNDPRDTASPQAMADMLTRIFSGKALSPASTEVIKGIMARCRTGEGRLRGLMPADTKVAHKTGTIGGTVNDVGVITLPRDGGQIVIAVYTKKSYVPMAAREHAIAEIARSVRDYYLYLPR
jgi:beta-lactamase class A